MSANRVNQILNIKYPFVQGSMNWLTSAELVAAVSNAGGLGLLGPNAGQSSVTRDPVETADRFRREIRKTRALTDKPFGAQYIMGVPGLADPFSEEILKVIQVLLDGFHHVRTLGASGHGGQFIQALHDLIRQSQRYGSHDFLQAKGVDVQVSHTEKRSTNVWLPCVWLS